MPSGWDSNPLIFEEVIRTLLRRWAMHPSADAAFMVQPCIPAITCSGASTEGKPAFLAQQAGVAFMQATDEARPRRCNSRTSDLNFGILSLWAPSRPEYWNSTINPAVSVLRMNSPMIPATFRCVETGLAPVNVAIHQHWPKLVGPPRRKTPLHFP